MGAGFRAIFGAMKSKMGPNKAGNSGTSEHHASTTDPGGDVYEEMYYEMFGITEDGKPGLALGGPPYTPPASAGQSTSEVTVISPARKSVSLAANSNFPEGRMYFGFSSGLIKNAYAFEIQKVGGHFAYGQQDVDRIGFNTEQDWEVKSNLEEDIIGGGLFLIGSKWSTQYFGSNVISHTKTYSSTIFGYSETKIISSNFTEHFISIDFGATFSIGFGINITYQAGYKFYSR